MDIPKITIEFLDNKNTRIRCGDHEYVARKREKGNGTTINTHKDEPDTLFKIFCEANFDALARMAAYAHDGDGLLGELDEFDAAEVADDLFL